MNEEKVFNRVVNIVKISHRVHVLVINRKNIFVFCLLQRNQGFKLINTKKVIKFK